MTQLQSVISTLRVQDAEASFAFFAKLGFEKVWEHRESEDFPLFIEVRRDSVSLFLSEHEGDGPQGVQIYVLVDDAQSLHDQFRAAGVACESAPEQQPWGHLVFGMEDLDGNVLRFGSPVTS